MLISALLFLLLYRVGIKKLQLASQLAKCQVFFLRDSVWPPACYEVEAAKECTKTKTGGGKCFCIRVVLSIKLRLIAVSYTHLTLPTNREV